MKILHLPPFYPPHVGGLQSHAQGFDQHLSQAGIAITTFTPRFPRTAPAEEHHVNLTIYRYPAVELIPNYPLPAIWKPKFWQQLRRVNPGANDVIVSRTRFFLPALFAALLARFIRKPYLHIEHGSDYVSLKSPVLQGLARLYDHTFGRLTLRLAHTVVANSQASAVFTQNLSGRDAAVIYRGVDKDVIAQTRSAGRPKHSPLIAFVGRLIDGKGVDDLLRAVKHLTSPYEVLIIGSGPQGVRLKKLTNELDLENTVSFLGEKSFTETISLLKKADIFVNPSHTEGLPTSVIEAALCKVPIIATDVGGTPEIITDGVSGILIPPRQSELLAEKMNLLLRDHALCQRLAESAFQEVSEKFDWGETTLAYQRIFDSLVKRP